MKLLSSRNFSRPFLEILREIHCHGIRLIRLIGEVEWLEAELNAVDLVVPR